MKVPVALSFLIAACASASPPPPSAPAQKQGRAERFEVGNLEAYALEDGYLDLPNDGQMLGFGRPASETAAVLAAAGLPRDTIRLDIQCLLVKAGDRVILFDTGTGVGDPTFPEAGRLLQSLALAGVRPVAVTDIFVSHAHGDHLGGLVTKDALSFPAATIHLSAPEWAALETDADPDSQRFVRVIAPKVAPFEPGAQVLSVVKAVATPGHTVGHSSYLIGADTEKLFYLGDLAHHSVISVQHPAWSMQADGDRPAAEAMRQKTLAKLAADHVRVFAGHFPFPGVGHIAASGQGLVWQPEAH